MYSRVPMASPGQSNPVLCLCCPTASHFPKGIGIQQQNGKKVPQHCCYIWIKTSVHYVHQIGWIFQKTWDSLQVCIKLCKVFLKNGEGSLKSCPQKSHKIKYSIEGVVWQLQRDWRLLTCKDTENCNF